MHARRGVVLTRYPAPTRTCLESSAKDSADIRHLYQIPASKFLVLGWHLEFLAESDKLVHFLGFCVASRAVSIKSALLFLHKAILGLIQHGFLM